MESLVSREATFLFNNLLLVGIAFAVLWGVLFPLISEAVGEKITVTTPFFEFFAVAFGLPLILLMGVGPVIAWRRASLEPASARSGPVAHRRWPPASLLVAVRLRRRSGRGARRSACRVRRRRASASSSPAARRPGVRWPAGRGRGRACRYVKPNRRRYGGYIVAPGRGHLVIGIDRRDGVRDQHRRCCSPARRCRCELHAGVRRLTASDGPNYRATAVSPRSRRTASARDAEPGRRSYPAEGQTTNEASIRTDWRPARTCS